MTEELKDLVIDHLIDGDPITTDFTLLSLLASSWEFERGARTVRKYRTSEGLLAVCDRYEYNFIDGGRSIDSYTRQIQWFNEDGTVGISKNVTPLLNQKKIKQMNRDFRQGRVDYLESAAEEYREAADNVPEPYKSQYNSIADSIDVLFSHYYNSIQEYISRGTQAFENLILTETSEHINSILDIPSAPPSPRFPEGLKVKTSILYQLRGWRFVEGDSDAPTT